MNAAANLFKCSTAQVLRDGEQFIGPQEEPVSFEDVVKHARSMGLALSAHGRWDAPTIHWSLEDGTGKPYFAYHYGAQVAEVSVDMGTGKVSVAGIWASHNTGTVIFPQGILGQLYGGITQGIGYALMERVDFDKGYIQATNFDEYLIPTALDVPDIEGHFVQKPFSPGPFGAKNIGEPAHGAHGAGHPERRLPGDWQAGARPAGKPGARAAGSRPAAAGLGSGLQAGAQGGLNRDPEGFECLRGLHLRNLARSEDRV